MKGLRTLAYIKLVKGLPILKASPKLCIYCVVGKQYCEPFPKKSLWRTSRPLQLVHSDIVGQLLLNRMVTRVPKEFWPEAINWAVYVLNRYPTSVVKDKTAEEVWKGVKPLVDYFKVFGCIGHVHKKNSEETHCIDFKWEDEGKGGESELEENEERGEENESEYCNSPTSTNATSPASGRKRIKPVWMKDYVSGEGLSEEEDEVQKLVMEIQLSMFVANDPTAFEEVAKSSTWREAMDQEIKGIEKNGTWKLTNLPIGEKKATDIDYNEIYAPIARWDTIRLILSLAANRDWKVYQLDVKSAFLHSEIDDEVFVEQPQGKKEYGVFSWSGSGAKLSGDFHKPKEACFMYVVGLIARFMEEPIVLHQQTVKRVFQYLKGTTELGILYKKRGEERLLAYSNSDSAGDLDGRKSTSGYFQTKFWNCGMEFQKATNCVTFHHQSRVHC
ncbi:copia-type polyprotein [Gossypium australe]|uniref:Copia-type polyprotein n=1 Tax=Gossypium australe TaxID=47621 RepID=A0A5B6VDY7_9ROSI|nr:copia-type polyprotein [Gossypium australe]